MDISICPLGLFVTISCGPVLRGFLLWVKMPRKQTAGHRCFQNAPKVPFPWHTLRFPWKPNVCSTHIPHKTVEMPQVDEVDEGISRAGQIWFFSPVFKMGRARTRNWQRVVRRRGRIHFLQSLICFLTKAASFQNKLRFLLQRNDFDPVAAIYHEEDEDCGHNNCPRWDFIILMRVSPEALFNMPNSNRFEILSIFSKILMGVSACPVSTLSGRHHQPADKDGKQASAAFFHKLPRNK